MSTKKMKCCYFPTTTVLVDDDWDFLVLSSMKLEKFVPCKLFKDPVKALKYINHDYVIQPFANKFFVKSLQATVADQRSISVDYTKIYQQIYDPNRFSEITGLLVDYAMPGLTGKGFCEQALATREWRNWNNIILLTGESKAHIVTEMIQGGLINGCIYKGDSDYLRKLLNMVLNRQAEYFEQSSELFIDLMTDSHEFMPSCLKDPAYIDFFYQMVERYKPLEYYLMDQSGTYIFLNEQAKVSWLILQSEADMMAAEAEMSLDNTVSVELLQAVKERRALRYFFNESSSLSPNRSVAWQNLIYPATKLEGHSNYYYSFVEEPLLETCIQHDKIASYADFRANR